MPPTDLLLRLLQQEGSLLALVARFSWRGFCVALEEAIQENPHDTGAEVAKELLRSLKESIDGGLSQDPFSSGSFSAVPPSSKAASSGSLDVLGSPSIRERLSEKELEEEPWFRAKDTQEDPFASSESFQPPAQGEPEALASFRESLLRFLREGRFPAVDPASFEEREGKELWLAIQAWGWRLSEEMAPKWKDKVSALASQEGLRLTNERSGRGRGPFGIMIFPGLSSPAIPSLSFSHDGAIHPAIDSLQKAARTSAPDLAEWSDFASLLLSWMESDPLLFHALEVIHRFQPVSLAGRQLEMLRDELLRRFQRICDEPFPSPEGFHARWEIDEVLHSLLYLPIPGPKTEWAKLRRHGRELFYQAKSQMDQALPGQIKIQSFPEDYRTLHKLQSTKNDLPISQGSSSGQVLADLRLWLKVLDRVYPGRVVYHS